MKKRIITLVVATILCLLISVPAFAAIIPRGSVGLSSGLTHVSGSTYNAWASVQAFQDENISVRFTLYKVNGKTMTYITSGSSSTDGTYAIAQKRASLSSGTYKLYASCSDGTQTNSSTKTYVID